LFTVKQKTEEEEEEEEEDLRTEKRSCPPQQVKQRWQRQP
jgi:hypothetical protein